MEKQMCIGLFGVFCYFKVALKTMFTIVKKKTIRKKTARKSRCA